MQRGMYMQLMIWNTLPPDMINASRPLSSIHQKLKSANASELTPPLSSYAAAVFRSFALEQLRLCSSSPAFGYPSLAAQGTLTNNNWPGSFGLQQCGPNTNYRGEWSLKRDSGQYLAARWWRLRREANLARNLARVNSSAPAPAPTAEPVTKKRKVSLGSLLGSKVKKESEKPKELNLDELE